MSNVKEFMVCREYVIRRRVRINATSKRAAIKKADQLARDDVRPWYYDDDAICLEQEHIRVSGNGNTCVEELNG